MLSLIIALSLTGPAVTSPKTAVPESADFYVATDGNDAWSGTLAQPNAAHSDGPFATLDRARDAVRALPNRADRDVKILIRGGTYRLAKTVVFSLQDSAPAGRTIRYVAYPGERPVFSGGRPVTNWKRPEENPDALPKKSRGHVWVADVSDRPMFRTLFMGRTPLPRARSAGFSPTNVTPRGSNDYQTVQFAPGKVHAYRNIAELELRIVPCFFWTMDLLPIDQIDLDRDTLTTAEAGTYPLGRNGMTDRDNAWIENGLEDLDEPGEWVRSTTEKKLYYWPKNGTPARSVVAPALTELIRIEGAIDYDGPADQPVQGIELRGLTFMHGDRYPWHGRTGWGLQHDWECFDKPTALVRLRGAERCVIEDCEFVASGHTAIRLDLHCQNTRVVGNDIHDIGGVGILLAGYGPGTKNVNRVNHVLNNHIHHIGKEYWGSGAIFAWQSGENHIAHNYIHHVPYTAILATGRISRTPPGPGECSRTVRWGELPETFRTDDWTQREPFLHSRKNLIECNDIHHAMQVLGDGNCIYISGTGGGNIVRHNYCHHCYGRYMNAVIRCDDDQNQTRIEGNICYRTAGYGEGVISKGDNDILNNIVVDLRPVQHHRGYIVFPYGSIAGAHVEHNILYSCGKDQVPYYFGPASQRRGQGPQLAGTTMDRNIYYCARDSQWAESHLAAAHALGLEKNSVQADPMFRSVATEDFDFAPKSPAVSLGIQPLDPHQAGLEDPYRRRFLGRQIRTHIQAIDQMLRGPTRVAITSSDPDAVVHYTLDGSEPDVTAPPYHGPLLVARPATVRARSFAAGATDLVGDRVVFTPPPAPIVEGFEESPVGAMVNGATTNEDARLTQYTVRVSDEQAATGKRSLKFSCGPGQERSFTPHIYYRRQFPEGRMVGQFAAWIDSATAFSYQWRDFRETYRRGPSVTIQLGGKLVHQQKELMTIPTGKWVRLEVAMDVGENAGGQFALRVWIPGDSTLHEFRNLPCDPQFQRLDWIGFASHAERPATYYIDDIEVRPER